MAQQGSSSLLFEEGNTNCQKERSEKHVRIKSARCKEFLVP